MDRSDFDISMDCLYFIVSVCQTCINIVVIGIMHIVNHWFDKK